VYRQHYNSNVVFDYLQLFDMSDKQNINTCLNYVQIYTGHRQCASRAVPCHISPLAHAFMCDKVNSHSAITDSTKDPTFPSEKVVGMIQNSSSGSRGGSVNEASVETSKAGT
jgi:hypothetical protein